MTAKAIENDIVVGLKQTLRMVEQENLAEVYIAKDADVFATRAVAEAAKANRIPIKYVDSKKKLGHLCGIDIGAATAGKIKKPAKNT